MAGERIPVLVRQEVAGDPHVLQVGLDASAGGCSWSAPCGRIVRCARLRPRLARWPAPTPAGITQFGRPEIPSPLASSGSARDRISDSGIASIRPTPNTGGGSRTEKATPGRRRLGHRARGWRDPGSAGRLTPAACRRRAPRCASARCPGRPRPSPLWQAAQETSLKIGPEAGRGRETPPELGVAADERGQLRRRQSVDRPVKDVAGVGRRREQVAAGARPGRRQPSNAVPDVSPATRRSRQY